MKRILLKSVFILFCIAFIAPPSNLSAQTAFIQSIVIVPSQPTINDQISAIVTSSFSSGACSQITQYVTILGNQINVQAGHLLGPLAYICTSIDTVDLGMLSAGNYTLNYNINASGATATDSVQFMVINPTNVLELNTNHIKLYPNPANDYLIIQSNTSEQIQHLSIFSLSGKKILKQDVNLYSTEKEEILVDIADISNGIYYLQLTFKDKILFKNLVIQH
ncbi:MAG: T9SS type A sorting domain-containing protein [Bacteroidia bacterium]|nr:T9SS type A sorting domain-containing protein [Bacteroidia bacterium]